MKRMSPDGIEVLHYYEQCKLKAYPDPGSPLAKAIRKGLPTAGLSGKPWTIAYGDTGPDVVEGLEITQADADARLAKRLAREFEPAVNAALKVDVQQCEFDALVDWTYNVGVAAMRDSTLMRELNLGRSREMVAERFLEWNKSGGEVLLGLRRRRVSDKWLFLGLAAARAIQLGQAVR